MRLFLICVLLLACFACSAPGSVEPLQPLPNGRFGQPWSLGGEVQGYPAGVILTVNARRQLSEHGALTVRTGYNFTERDDFGEHDDEDGGGPGFGVGYRHSFAPHSENGWLAGGRVDLWFLQVDWEDDPNGSFPNGRDGTTDVVVLQPTVEGGYGWRVGSGRVELTLAVGAEINVHEDGEDVGEGAIGLLGVSYFLGS